MLGIFASCSKIQKASLESASENNAVKITRLDKMQADYIINGNPLTAEEMTMNCPEETKILIENVLHIGTVNEPNIIAKIRNYFTDSPERLQLVKDVEKKFDSMGTLEKDLKKAFQTLHQEVPGINEPHFYTQISGFNQSMVVGDSILGISLDKYMGKSYPAYKKYFYDTQIRQMEPKRIVPDCVQFWLESKYPLPQNKQTTLLQVMIHFGKIHWTTRYVIGESYDDLLYESTGMSKSEWENRWTKMRPSLLTRRNLLSTNKEFIRHFMIGQPKDKNKASAKNRDAGILSGITIVGLYMKNHPTCSVNDLLNNSNSAEILKGAGFHL